jgi:NTE family protein
MVATAATRLHPLIYQCESPDVMIVQINPIHRDEHPDSAQEIMDRSSELTFNASLLSQVRAIDFVQRMLAEDRLDPTRYKNVRLHRIDGGEKPEAYGAHSKTSAQRAMIESLRDLGRESAKAWLEKHFHTIGERGIVNIARDYLDDMRMGTRTPHQSTH